MKTKLALSEALVSLSLLCLGTSCYRHVLHLPAGPVAVSGQIIDATGAPLANRDVLLFRDLRYLDTKTGANGQYAFLNLATATYRVEPRRDSCYFLPREAYLRNVTVSVVENFGGIGLNCGGAPTVNLGGMNGPYAISGHLRDAAGQAIVGGRVDLIEGDRFKHHLAAVRFTDFTGSYSFLADRRKYDLRVSGACNFTPRYARLHEVHANVVRDFVGGGGCQIASTTNTNPAGSVFTVRQGGTLIGVTYVRAEQRASAADAAARLAEIAAEQPSTPSKPLTIAGFPAIERQTLLSMPGIGHDLAGDLGTARQTFLALTTAIADGSTVVRFESQLAAQATAATIALFRQTARNFTPESLSGLHGPPNPIVPTVRHPAPPAPPVNGLLLPGVLPSNTDGELQLAASDVANVVVYGTQVGPYFSTNGGQTVVASTFNYVNPPSATTTHNYGDPTLTKGAPYGSSQQNLYLVQEEGVLPAPAGGLPTVATGLYQSTDNGQTFNSVSFPVNCALSSAGCVVPDQEQIAGDRLTQAVTSSGSADQLYLTWRNFPSATSGAREIGVACSVDGGKTWTTDLTTLNTTGGDFGRPVVGPDGSLLVAFELFGSATSAVKVQKWSSCANGFKAGTLGTVAAAITDVSDMPGLDRPASANYSIAFDDSDGSGQRIFAVYSNEATAGNDDVHAAESVDGGATWTRDSIVNAVSNGRRYFPWLCSSVGTKFVAWYDRRNSTPAKPDLTAYYRSTIFDNGSANSVGIGAEKNVSGVDDPQCAPGFPDQVSGAIEESGCKDLPSGFIQGGTCQSPCLPGQTGPCGSQQACDFRATPQCATAGETCTPGGGDPKYGDYNGSACSQGTFYMAWASATAPAGGGCLLPGVLASNASQCCSGLIAGGACVAAAGACTPNGGACGSGQPACCSAAVNGLCQAGTCLPAIGIYASSSCIGPACAGLPVTVTYHQVGACNGFATSTGITSVGPNAAFVFYRIESINNSQGTVNFSFNGANFFVQQTNPVALDPPILVPQIFGSQAVASVTVNAGQDLQFATGQYAAIVVQTTASDGATEADHVVYPLSYKRGSSDPPVTLVNSNPARTSWPLTEDCTTVVLQ